MDTTMNAAEKPELKPANDNPWYWLATLYGEWKNDSKLDKDIARKNRIAWNRWFANAFPAEQRDELLKKGFSPEELVPWTSTEEAELAIAFTTRSGRTDQSLPNPARKIDFSHTIFDSNVSMTKFHFPNGVNFTLATFSGTADFESATFSGDAYFDSATFSERTNFTSATFSGNADFKAATFFGDANFRLATFSGVASFGSTFSGYTNFGSVTFSGFTNFMSAKFSGGAYFVSAKFSKDTLFILVTFTSGIDFKNSESTAMTLFSNAHFKSEVPDFRGAKLHEATEWHGVGWPAPPDKTIAQRQVYAYERLKQEMERLKKHEDEQFFFCKELRARRELAPLWSVARFLNYLYAVLSDYGQSTSKPLLWLCGLFLLVSDVFAWVPEITGTSMTIPQAASLSFASIFAIFPLPKGILDPDVFASLSSLAKIIVVVAAFFGTLLLFLLGVALRNRFRLR